MDGEANRLWCNAFGAVCELMLFLGYLLFPGRIQNVNDKEPVTLSLFVRFRRLYVKWYFLKSLI